MTADNPVTVASHAKANNMLDKEGWRKLKRMAKREKVLTRPVNHVGRANAPETHNPDQDMCHLQGSKLSMASSVNNDSLMVSGLPSF